MRPPFLVSWVTTLLAAVTILVVTMQGCGRTSLEPESLRDGGATGVCGPTTCPTGCCDAAGTCRTGGDVRACGSAGARCSDCVSGGFTLCNAAHVCGRSDPACSAASCTGCCSIDEGERRCLSGSEPAACGGGGAECSNCGAGGRGCDRATRACTATSCTAATCAGCCVGGQCLPGDVATACGTAGVTCTTCAAGQVCRGGAGGGGSCEGTPSCSAANCGGCCDAAGRCQTGTDAPACGRQGERCQACAPGQACVGDGLPNARTCRSQPCGPSTCAGCCVGTQCVVATTAQACGARGEACRGCGVNEVCSAGSCVPGSDCNAPTPCAGCCVGDICAVGNQNTACGGGGAECQNCANQPGNVCQSGACQPQACGPGNCPNGCCSGNTCVTGTQDFACGPTGGAACVDCTASGQVCQARVCRPPCGPGCNGCCRNNECELGTANNACGQNGAECTNCTTSNSFCNGLVEPRRCNNQQSTCPAPYERCPAGTATPITPQLQNVCSDAQLDAVAAACVGGAESAGCTVAVGGLPEACSRCLGVFNHPFNEHTGLYACVAPTLTNACRRSTGCATACETTSCGGCSATSEDQCWELVDGSPNGQCRSFHNAATTCTDAALQSGVCSPFAYANFGQWLRSVGDRFCGNGP